MNYPPNAPPPGGTPPGGGSHGGPPGGGGYGGPPGGGGYGGPPGGGGYGGPPGGGGYGGPPPGGYGPPPGGFGAPPGGFGGAPGGGMAMVPGAPYGIDPVSGLPFSDKSRMVAGLLNLGLPLVGICGVGRFYTGHIGLGVAQLLLGWLTCGIWPLVDGIMMLMGRVPDAQGRPLRE